MSVRPHTLALLGHHRAVRALLAAAAPDACHLVGGVLRDRLLGLPAHDFDAVVAGRGREIAETLATALPARLVLLGGKEFAAYRLVARDCVVDLWDRADMTMDDDLARRDFTVNAMAWDPRTGTLIDPFNGLADLDRRALRATTPASFTGDPLRVLRLPRLAVQLPGFAAGPATLGLARAAAPQLTGVAAERVREELALLLAHPEAHRGVALLAALDVYPGLWLGRPGEPAPHGVAGAAVRDLEELEGVARTVRDAADLAPASDSPAEPFTDPAAQPSALDLPLLRQVVLLHHLPGNEPVRHLVRLRDAGYLPQRPAKEAARLIEVAGRWPELPAEEVERRRFLHAAGPDWPTAAALLGIRAAVHGRTEGWQKALRPLAALARREGAGLFDPPRLLTGEEVAEILGVPPGPAVGRALAALRAAQVDGRVGSREEAEAMVRGLRS